VTAENPAGGGDLVELIRTAAFKLQAAVDGDGWAAVQLLGRDFAELLATWLFEAANRERVYRRDEPNYDPPAEWEEAWTASLLACQLLGRDPAEYDIDLPEE